MEYAVWIWYPSKRYMRYDNAQQKRTMMSCQENQAKKRTENNILQGLVFALVQATKKKQMEKICI